MKIVTDSTADLPKELVEEYDISIVPLTVRLGGRTFRDYYDVTPAEFYQMLGETDDFPTTSQPSVEDFLTVYEELGEKEKIISIHISLEMSATAQSANVALQQLQGRDISIVDSRTTSIGLGLIALEAAKAVKEGADDEEVMDLVLSLKERTRTYFSVDSLDYLQKGGRIGKAQALLGSMLKIKPLLAVEEGMVVPVSKIRGTNKLIREMANIVKTDGAGKVVKGGFIWGESDESIPKMRELINASVQFEEIYSHNIGTVITSHTGPTTFGVSYFCEE